jgi:hypothetical protein
MTAHLELRKRWNGSGHLGIETIFLRRFPAWTADRAIPGGKTQRLKSVDRVARLTNRGPTSNSFRRRDDPRGTSSSVLA